MKAFGAFVIVGLILMVVILGAAGYASDKAAKYEYERGRSEAMVIRAQSAARLDSAAAGALVSAALVPYAALTCLGTLGLSIVALCIVVVTHRPQKPERVIERHYVTERHVVYLPAPRQPRREVWQAISQRRQPLLIEHRSDNVHYGDKLWIQK